MKNRLPLAAAAAAIALATPTSGQAADEHNVTSGITTSGAPLALHGVDAVALSLLKAIAPGDANHSVVRDGVAYYFASAESARLFMQAPAKYMPQYGGFCAYAVALGKKFDGDPRFADIVDGKLYLFVNAEIFAEYLKDKANVLAKAEATWPEIQHTPVEDL